MYSKNDVKEFIEMLEGSSLSVLEIKNGDGSAIRLEKAISAAPAVVMQANAPASVNESAPVAAPAAAVSRAEIARPPVQKSIRDGPSSVRLSLSANMRSIVARSSCSGVGVVDIFYDSFRDGPECEFQDWCSPVWVECVGVVVPRL